MNYTCNECMAGWRKSKPLTMSEMVGKTSKIWKCRHPHFSHPIQSSCRAALRETLHPVENNQGFHMTFWIMAYVNKIIVSTISTLICWKLCSRRWSVICVKNIGTLEYAEPCLYWPKETRETKEKQCNFFSILSIHYTSCWSFFIPTS